MENEKKIKIAFIQGDCLNEWKGSIWEKLGDEFVVQGFCSKKNLYGLKDLQYPVTRLFSSSDNFFLKNFDKYVRGRYKAMYGLERYLVGFDLAHTDELFNFYTAQAVRSKKNNPNLKVVVNFSDNTFGRFEYNYWPGFKYPPQYWRQQINEIVAETIKGADMFITQTEYSAELLRDYGVPNDQIKLLVLPIIKGADQDYWATLAAKYQLQEKEFFMCVVRLTKEKGIYETLYAWRMFKRQMGAGDKKKLLIIGNGPEQTNVLRLIKELNLSESIVYIEHLTHHQEVLSLYPHAKALILASIPTSTWQEQFGHVLTEAIYNNCPVIGTYSGSIPEVIEDAGLLCAPGNPVDLRDAMLKLEDFSLYKQLLQNCSRVALKFSLEDYRRDLAQIYHEVLNS